MLQVPSHTLVLMFFNLCLGSWPRLCSLLSLMHVQAIQSEMQFCHFGFCRGCSVAFVALMGGKGTVWAFDRDAKRLDRLKANAAAAGAANIVAQQVCWTQPRMACTYDPAASLYCCCSYAA